MTTFTIATNEYRGGGNAERTEYHPCVGWDRLAEICGQFLSKGQLVDTEGRLQTRQWYPRVRIAGVPECVPLIAGHTGECGYS